MTKNIVRLGLVLAAFAAGACVALAFVYTVTAPAIAGHAKVQLEETLKELFPGASDFSELPDVAPDAAIKITGAWKAVKGDMTLGIAIRGEAPSYGGPAVMLTGIGIDNRITGTRVLNLSDTPGLGANAANPAYFVSKADKITFLGQFDDKLATAPFVVKEDVIAITASTITSKALAGIVKESGRIAMAWFTAHVSGGK